MTPISDTVTNNTIENTTNSTPFFPPICQTEDQRVKMSAKKQLFLHPAVSTVKGS